MNRCISIFVLFALLATAIGGPNRMKFEASKQKCIAETGVDPELVKGPPHMDEPVDDKVKCFAACLMKEHGGFKEDGSFNLDQAIAKIPDDIPDKEEMVAAITACADKKGDNECDTAHQIAMCIHGKMPHMRGPPHHD